MTAITALVAQHAHLMLMSIQTSHILLNMLAAVLVYPDSTSSYHDGDIEQSIVESFEESIVESTEESIAESIAESIVESIEERSLFCVRY